MTSFLLAPVVLATFAALAAAWLKRMPTRQFCPTCRHKTQTVVAPAWLRPASGWLVLRWCADCDWQAVGRKGPEWVQGKQVAHDSGFHWGDDVRGENMGFRWRRTEPEPAVDTPPHHPSGFRFAAGEEAVQPEPDHPSGFVWGRRRTDRDGGERRSQRGGFHWGGAA